MKKLALIAPFAAAGLMLFAFTTKLTDSFEGVITYTIKVDSDNPQAASMMQGMTYKTYIKGDKSRTDVNSGMFKQIIIADKKNPDGTVILMDFMGNKYQMKLDDKAKKEAEDSKPEIKYLDGTKTIAGYSCKEAQAIVKDKRSGNKYTSDIYYTDQLPYSESKYSQFNGLKGFPLSFNMQQGGVNMSMTAQSIEKQSVPDSVFNIPSGYKLMTSEEMQKDIMQKMSGGGGQ